MDRKEISRLLMKGQQSSINVVRATQKRTGILYSRYRYLDNPRKVMEVFGNLFAHAGVESVLAIAVTKKTEPVAIQVVGIGGLDSAGISIPDILRFVLLSNCNDLILVHNHPSGNPMASFEDICITERMEKACELMGMNLLDHVIVGEDGTGYSYRQEKMIYNEELEKGA